MTVTIPNYFASFAHTLLPSVIWREDMGVPLKVAIAVTEVFDMKTVLGAVSVALLIKGLYRGVVNSFTPVSVEIVNQRRKGYLSYKPEENLIRYRYRTGASKCLYDNPAEPLSTLEEVRIYEGLVADRLRELWALYEQAFTEYDRHQSSPLVTSSHTHVELLHIAFTLSTTCLDCLQFLVMKDKKPQWTITDRYLQDPLRIKSFKAMSEAYKAVISSSTQNGLAQELYNAFCDRAAYFMNVTVLERVHPESFMACQRIGDPVDVPVEELPLLEYSEVAQKVREHFGSSYHSVYLNCEDKITDPVNLALYHQLRDANLKALYEFYLLTKKEYLEDGLIENPFYNEITQRSARRYLYAAFNVSTTALDTLIISKKMESLSLDEAVTRFVRDPEKVKYVLAITEAYSHIREGLQSVFRNETLVAIKFQGNELERQRYGELFYRRGTLQAHLRYVFNTFCSRVEYYGLRPSLLEHHPQIFVLTEADTQNSNPVPVILSERQTRLFLKLAWSSMDIERQMALVEEAWELLEPPQQAGLVRQRGNIINAQEREDFMMRIWKVFTPRQVKQFEDRVTSADREAM